MRTRIIFVAICMLLAGSPVPAAVFGNLYQVRIEVEGRDTETMNQAFKDAMVIVLSRVTGKRRDSEAMDIEALVSRARDFVQQFGFIDRRNMLISFDGQAIIRQLGEMGEPVWGQERPATLVWLVLSDQTGQREILGADDRGTVTDNLKEAANQRGVPVIIPLMDAQDQQAIAMSDLRGAFEDKILEASERYDADAILVGTARMLRGPDPEKAGYQVRWTLFFAGQTQSWRGDIASGVDGAADRFSNVLAVIGNNDNDRQLVLVKGIEDLVAYGRVSQYLESLSLVDSLAVERVQGNEVLFSLELRAGVDRLSSAIRLGKVLFSEDADYSLLAPGTIVYRYRN